MLPGGTGRRQSGKTGSKGEINEGEVAEKEEEIKMLAGALHKLHGSHVDFVSDLIERIRELMSTIEMGLDNKLQAGCSTQERETPSKDSPLKKGQETP